MRTRCHMQGKSHNGSIFQDIDQGHLAHLFITGVQVIGHMDCDDKDDQQRREEITGELYILVGKKGKPHQDKSGTHGIGPADTTHQAKGNIYQQVAGIVKMEKAKGDQYNRQQVDRQPGNDMIMLHDKTVCLEQKVAHPLWNLYDARSGNHMIFDRSSPEADDEKELLPGTPNPKHQTRNMLSPSFLITHYNLQPHPEGGWFRQTYRSGETLKAGCLPERFGGDRPVSTAIYFLLEQGNFSAFHRIKSDECWHFYAGGPLEIYELHAGGRLKKITLGPAIADGELFQYMVPAGCWFASRPAAGVSFSFVGCTVAPGFDFADFEMAAGKELAVIYPQQKAIIETLCRV